MSQSPQESLLETPDTFFEAESASEISAYTPRVHDWMQTRPCSEASIIALHALDFRIETATPGNDIQPLEAVRGVLLMDGKGYVKDSGYDGVILTESQQAIIAECVANLADQIPAALISGKLEQYAPHIAAARFYDGRSEHASNVPADLPERIGIMASKYCFPQPFPAPKPTTTHISTSPTSAELNKAVVKDRSWHAINIGPITLGVAFKRKVA